MDNNSDPQKIPCVYMRGGTSKGPFFKADDLPNDEESLNKTLLDIMGSPHPLQVDGIGGSQPQTSKVAIISKSDRDDVDIEYLFAQVSVDQAKVDTSPNCGNMLSAAAPFAIEEGLYNAQQDITKVRIFNRNTGAVIHSEVQTPNGQVSYQGDQQIDGVPGTGAPIFLHFLNAEGTKTGHFFPTGQGIEIINNTPVTLIDFSVPMMLIDAKSLAIEGNEAAEWIDGNRPLIDEIEKLRIEAGKRMGLGDVSDKVIPKVSILSQAHNNGQITSRYLMPKVCHKSHAITGALCIASACYVKGTVASNIIEGPFTENQQIVIEHPSGKIDLKVVLEEQSTRNKINSIAVVRTARRMFEGNVYTH